MGLNPKMIFPRMNEGCRELDLFLFPWKAETYFKGADFCGEYIEYKGDMKEFLLKLESFGVMPINSDGMRTINSVCKEYLGRYFKPAKEVAEHIRHKEMLDSGIIKNIDRTKSNR